MTDQGRPRYIRAAEIAKMIRVDLKRHFPTVKFSVRTEHGTSVAVTWTDGPTTHEVEKVTGPYQGARFDGMYDLEYVARPWYCPEHGARVAETYGHSFTVNAREGHGNAVHDSRCCAQAELINSGANYIFERRELSPEFRQELEDKIAEDYGRPYDPMTRIGGCWMSDLVHRLQVETAR